MGSPRLLWGRSTGVIRPGREAEKSRHPNIEDKDGWSLELYFCTPHMPGMRNEYFTPYPSITREMGSNVAVISRR